MTKTYAAKSTAVATFTMLSLALLVTLTNMSSVIALMVRP